MIPITVGALGTVLEVLERRHEELKNNGRIETIQTKTWLKSTWILKVLEEYQASSTFPCPVWFVTFMISANPVSNIWRVSGELDISQSSVAHYLPNLSKCGELYLKSIRWARHFPVPCGSSPSRFSAKIIRSWRIGVTLKKYCKTFNST